MKTERALRGEQQREPAVFLVLDALRQVRAFLVSHHASLATLIRSTLPTHSAHPHGHTHMRAMSWSLVVEYAGGERDGSMMDRFWV